MNTNNLKKHLKIGRIMTFTIVILPSWLLAADVVKSLEAPARISNGGTYALQINYTADATRSLVLTLMNTKTSTAYGQTVVSAQPGEGTVDVELEIKGNPPLGSDYVWQAALQEASSISETNMVMRKYLNVSVNSGIWYINVPQNFTVEILTLSGKRVQTFSSNNIGMYSWKPEISGSYIIRAAQGQDELNRLITVNI